MLPAREAADREIESGGRSPCRLEYHHDHLGDLIKRNYRERNPRSKDRDINIQTARGERALLSLVERFEETLICIDCNLTEGRAKLALGDDVDPNFTFTPSEIAGFIDVAANRLHEIDMDKARQAWAAAKDGFADRIDFAQRMAQRIAAGRHRREIAPGQSLFGPIEERDLIHRLFSEASPKGYVFRLARHIEARSVSYDSAGQSPVVKRKPGGRAPNDAEFAAVEEQQRETKGWMLAGPDWRCPCCDRSKREICRKSNKGGWTATIHRFTTYEAEDREESLYWRRRESSSDIIIGATREALICHDCRNIVAELQRRKPGLTPQCLTCEDFRVLVGGGAPHTPHMIDYDLAATMAIANAPLLEAIEDFNNHRVKALQTFAEAREIMNLMSWTWRKACEIIGFEFAKANGLELEEGDALAEWMLSEGRRFRENFSG